MTSFPVGLSVTGSLWRSLKAACSVWPPPPFDTTFSWTACPQVKCRPKGMSVAMHPRLPITFNGDGGAASFLWL